jgi:hypothetical protein
MEGFSKYHFKDLGSEEEIIKVLHRNWFYLFQQFFLIFVIMLFFVGSIFAVPIFFPNIIAAQYAASVAFMENLMMLAIWIYGFLIWVDYYFDIWIITSERVINIEQRGMFTRKVSELRFAKIEDITTEVKGFLPTVINYGDVKIQTAAEEAEFLFRTVSDPYEVKNIIMGLQRKNENSKTEEFGEMIKEKIQGE